MAGNETMTGIALAVVSFNAIIHQIAGWGYFGVFLISVISNATIILPVPSLIFVFLLSGELNPILLALLSGLGSAIGELTSYGIGLGGVALTEQKKKHLKKKLDGIEKMFQKYGGFWVIVLFAATPLPFDIVGLGAGALRYPPKKFFIATFIGKFIISLIVALAGFYSMNSVIDFLGIS